MSDGHRGKGIDHHRKRSEPQQQFQECLAPFDVAPVLGGPLNETDVVVSEADVMSSERAQFEAANMMSWVHRECY